MHTTKRASSFGLTIEQIDGLVLQTIGRKQGVTAGVKKAAIQAKLNQITAGHITYWQVNHSLRRLKAAGKVHLTPERTWRLSVNLVLDAKVEAAQTAQAAPAAAVAPVTKTHNPTPIE